MSIDYDSPRPDMVAYISVNGFDEPPEEANIAHRFDLMGMVFFFASMLSVVLLEAEFDRTIPLILGGVVLLVWELDW